MSVQSSVGCQSKDVEPCCQSKDVELCCQSQDVESCCQSKDFDQCCQSKDVEPCCQSKDVEPCCHCGSNFDVIFTCITCARSKQPCSFCPKCRNTRHGNYKCKIAFKMDDNDGVDSIYDKTIHEKVNIQLSKTYRFTDRKLKYEIKTICPIDEYTLWAFNDNEETSSVLFITLNEDIDYKEVFRSEDIFEMSYSKSGYLYLTLNKEIIRIDLKGKVEKFLDCTPLACCGIYAYDSGDIVVGLIENEFDADPLHKIVKYNKSGELMSEFEYNIKDTPNFIDAIPQFITVNPVNGDILILDWNGEVQNRIVALTPNGDVHWIFHGIFDKPKDNFYPNGICCTEDGNVFIMENRLTVLRSDGALDATSSFLDNDTEPNCITLINRKLFYMINDKSEIQVLTISGVRHSKLH